MGEILHPVPPPPRIEASPMNAAPMLPAERDARTMGTTNANCSTTAQNLGNENVVEVGGQPSTYTLAQAPDYRDLRIKILDHMWVLYSIRALFGGSASCWRGGDVYAVWGISRKNIHFIGAIETADPRGHFQDKNQQHSEL